MGGALRVVVKGLGMGDGSNGQDMGWIFVLHQLTDLGQVT